MIFFDLILQQGDRAIGAKDEPEQKKLNLINNIKLTKRIVIIFY